MSDNVVPSSKKKKRRRKKKKKKSANPNPTHKRARRVAEQNVEEEEEERKERLIDEARSYLETWSSCRTKWKFRKAKQSWLLRWMYHPKQVNKAMFTLLLPYLTGLKGAGRDRTYEKAVEVRDAYEEMTKRAASNEVEDEKKKKKKDDSDDDDVDDVETKKKKTAEQAKERKRVKKVLIRSRKVAKLLKPAENDMGLGASKEDDE